MSGKKISWLPGWAQKIAGLSSDEPAVIGPGDLMEAESQSGARGATRPTFELHRCPVCKGAMQLHGLKDFGLDLSGHEVWLEDWRCVGCGKRLDEVQLMAGVGA